MADAAFAAWMAKAEPEAPRGEEFYKNLADALKADDVTHWTHLLEVDPSSLKSLDSAGKAGAISARASCLPVRRARWAA